jgi:hypothetical protein
MAIPSRCERQGEASMSVTAEVPHWVPGSEDDLAEAIRLGLLEEGHHLDLKREISTSRASNKELARDLASFAVDGGILLVGISEDNETGALSLAPQPLAGLAERIEMVARTIADPPLSVLCSPIRSALDPSLGYLVVRVPPSSAAPHMVEHRYLGRGDKTKLYLSDADVRRLHERRQATEQDALALLQEEFDRDPIPPEDRKQAHLFLLARPSAPMPQMLLNLVHGQDAPARLVKFARSVDTPELRELLGSAGGFSPPLSYASDFALRSAGAALTYGLASDRSWAPASRVSPEDVVEVEVDEDGGLRVFMSRLSDSLESADAAASGQRLLTSGAVTYARQFIALTAAAADHANYLGNWILAAGATGIKGIPVHDYLLHGRSGPRQDAPVYQRATSASYAELLKQPGTVADRLIGRLLRATGTYDLYASAVANPPDPR